METYYTSTVKPRHTYIALRIVLMCFLFNLCIAGGEPADGVPAEGAGMSAYTKEKNHHRAAAQQEHGTSYMLLIS